MLEDRSDKNTNPLIFIGPVGLAGIIVAPPREVAPNADELVAPSPERTGVVAGKSELTVGVSGAASGGLVGGAVGIDPALEAGL